MSEHGSETEPGGALTAPRHPTTALAASAPMRRQLARPSASRVPRYRTGLRGLVESALDGLDAIADRLAEAAGLR